MSPLDSVPACGKNSMKTILIVPSLKISGGIREALRLISEVASEEHHGNVLSMWKSPHEMSTSVPVEYLSALAPRLLRAPIELPLLMLRFRAWLGRPLPPTQAVDSFIFTHYSTLPLALLVPRAKRLFFVQDLEWNFIGSGFPSRLLRSAVLKIYGSGRIISANAYLSRQLTDEGLDVEIEAPIWADPFFEGPQSSEPDVDFVMVLRKGAHKRLDLYIAFMALARKRGLRVAAITPEDAIAELARAEGCEVLLRPTASDMKELYGRSKCFIHLSEHEGFGLPPLEAMGSGCVPLCRNSGGVQAFMLGAPFAAHLLPLTLSVEAFFKHAVELISDRPQLEQLRAAAKAKFDTGLQITIQARHRLAATMRAGVA